MNILIMCAKINIHFLGAAGTVTGSKIILDTPEGSFMIDCGLFQGIKQFRLLNWKNLDFDVGKLKAVLLTHGHLDHTGYLPCLVKQGFKGEIIGTGPTLAITRIILEDSAKIQEETAAHANEEGYSVHTPALPLYTVADVEETCKLFTVQPKEYPISLTKNISFRFRYSGHILGATFVEMKVFGKTLIFSGDVGRFNDPVLHPPSIPDKADFLFLESTYGDRLHPEEDVEEVLTSLINETLYNRGNLIIPAFAVERAQLLIYTLWKLFRKNKIPDIPIIVDTPMGIDTLKVFESYQNWHRLTKGEFYSMQEHIKQVTSYRETWEVIDNPRPKVIIAGSGMITGGRVLTYIKQLGRFENTTILLVGYQAEGTRGRQLQEGIKELKIFGKYVPVHARIRQLHSLSAHADQSELIKWVSQLKTPPEKVFLVHGEPGAADAFRVKLKSVFGWDTIIPKLGDIVNISI